MSTITYRERDHTGVARCTGGRRGRLPAGRGCGPGRRCVQAHRRAARALWGAPRVDTPISEQAIVGAAIGAAVMGLRPVAEIMFADFTGVCFDQIANELAKYRYMTGGQVTLPVTVRPRTAQGPVSRRSTRSRARTGF